MGFGLMKEQKSESEKQCAVFWAFSKIQTNKIQIGEKVSEQLTFRHKGAESPPIEIVVPDKNIIM